MALQIQELKGQNFFKNERLVRVSGEGRPFLIEDPFIELEFTEIATPPNPDEKTEKHTGYFFTDNFVGSSLNGLFWSSTTGTGGSITVSGGIVSITGGNAGEDTYIRHLSDSINNKTKIIMEARVRRNIGSVGAGTDDNYLGLYEFTQGHHVMFDTGVTTADWTPKTFNGSSTLGTPISITNNTWIIAKIEVTASEAKFYINNILKETITTNITTKEIGFIMRAEGSSTFECEWMRIEFDPDRVVI